MLPRSAVATSLSRCISTAFRAPVATRTFSTSLLRQKIEENISGARLQEMLQKQDTKPLLVDFYAEWCGPCKMLSPILHKLATTPDLVGGKEVDLVTVDVDSHMETAQKYGIRAMPTVIAFKDGKQVTSFVGVLPEAQLRQFIEAL
ncbi:unnamed protein product [Malassezia sympodialis ATCC 42132]|uniref:Similar to S.cerevisiae protein TRX1 (Cytoplasmic thioredoxin isoenzyme) n=1 Tax=Malassezia sympodialis (strain ATCC 42132) TaxID=1230383 RepID=M5E5P0_MALS4|nr:uncharacterized protein MSY001_0443 [Malassezia sympodialis ATCC 42132]CCU97737.1 unnamed protein product [Malassezia sympodialis ATCC 42132]SHO77905.1 Similar to S.cerevisiae protein TRX1 (Cytoplasmic thioredoxin isoenzyme) [Malassezia sympodialis ATCC 42132]|eukprot:XP_018739073.1 uncharacterized protein MSY001_0443 [Malassezia sympodialis ATCC 42132]